MVLVVMVGLGTEFQSQELVFFMVEVVVLVVQEPLRVE
jgi:hypothetical protein